jgi:8-hydroxy-5-deazaflavin:NADPH oxidoreductase
LIRREPELTKTTLGIIGAGAIGSQVAHAASAHGFNVVIPNSRAPETLSGLIQELGPSAHAATAEDAAAAGDFVVVTLPLQLVNDLRVEALAGNVVLDTHNYMIWRDGHFPVIDSGEKTVSQLRQEQPPESKSRPGLYADSSPRITTAAKAAGSSDRLPVPKSSDFPGAIELVARLFDPLGFDSVDNSPLSEAWRSAPGQPAWVALEHQNPARAHHPPGQSATHRTGVTPHVSPEGGCPREAVTTAGRGEHPREHMRMCSDFKKNWGRASAERHRAAHRGSVRLDRASQARPPLGCGLPRVTRRRLGVAPGADPQTSGIRRPDARPQTSGCDALPDPQTSGAAVLAGRLQWCILVRDASHLPV